MKYIRSTFEYVKHNGLGLLLFSLIPSLLYALVIEPTKIFRFFLKLQTAGFSTFEQIFKAFNDIRNPWWLVLILGVVIVAAIPASAMVGSIERKMMYGADIKPTVHSVFKQVNNCYLPTLLCVFSLLICIQLLILLMCMFVFFWLKLGSAASIVLTVITAVVFGLICVFLASFATLALPNMTVKGFGLFKAVKQSFIDTSRKIWRFFIALGLPLAVALIPLCLVSVFNFPGAFVLRFIFAWGFFLLAHMYYFPLMYVAFFDVEEMEREDLKKNSYWEGLNRAD